MLSYEWTVYWPSELTQGHERTVHPLSLKGVNSTHLDLLRLASAAAAWRSWVDLLTGTPNTALWVTSLRMRLWPLFGAIFGDEGGVKEPTLWIPRPAVCNERIVGWFRIGDLGKVILTVRKICSVHKKMKAPKSLGQENVKKAIHHKYSENNNRQKIVMLRVRKGGKGIPITMIGQKQTHLVMWVAWKYIGVWWVWSSLVSKSKSFGYNLIFAVSLKNESI